MRGITSWQFKPYVRPFEAEKASRPYISVISPKQCGFDFEWFDNGCKNICHTINFRKRDRGEYCSSPLTSYRSCLENLENYTDYEFFIARSDGSSSPVRLVRTGDRAPADSVVNYLHPEDNIYEYSGHALCAPNLVKLPSGKILVMTDICCDRTRTPSDPSVAILMESTDNGNTWNFLSEIRPAFNSKLFYHNDKLYCLALSSDYSDLIIGCSEDEGLTWTPPITILRGEGVRRYGWHRGSYPIVEKNGRLFTGIEYGHVCEIHNPIEEDFARCTPIDMDPRECHYRNAFRASDTKVIDLAHYVGVLSIDSDADLMIPENWYVSPLYYPYDEDPRQCIEGNIVELPDGKLYNFLRTIRLGKSLLLKLDENNPSEGVLSFVDLIDNFPLSAISKFVIKQDAVTGKYIALGNLSEYGRQVLAMVVSDDFKSWKTSYIIADGRETHSGFSYPDWQFDGEDIILVSRTAWNGAADHHDTNTITFHRIPNFRNLI